MEIILRLGNLGLAKTHSYSKDPVEYYEIIRYYPNPYYGKENEYVKTEFGNYQIPGHQCFIDASCFKHPESCYTIGIFRQNNDEEPDFESVGSRIVVEPEEAQNLNLLLRHFYENNLWQNLKYDEKNIYYNTH